MKRNIYLIIAGVINLFTAFIHVIAGQFDLVDPLIESALNQQIKTEWLSVWHIITVTLFLSAFYLLRQGIKPSKNDTKQLIQFIGFLYTLYAFVFVICSLFMSKFAPQWILLLPIGILAILGATKSV